MAERCLELLNLPDDKSRLVLDIGCGSGLSGGEPSQEFGIRSRRTAGCTWRLLDFRMLPSYALARHAPPAPSADILAEHGHAWVGLDISQSMLDVAVERGCLESGDVLRADMGSGFGFRAGTFDGAVSVSALQWLCYNDRKDHKSVKRLDAFFTSLYRCLRRGARAALQFYPENETQLELITAVAHRCGFTGGLVVDFPNSTKAKKYYLVIFAGVDPDAAAKQTLPKALGTAGGGSADDDEDEEDDQAGGAGAGSGSGGQVNYEARRAKHKSGKRREKSSVKGKAWIQAKKQAQSRRGVEVRPDSKYTGRKRGPRF